MQQISKLASWPKSFICRSGSWLGHTTRFLSLTPDATMPRRSDLDLGIYKPSCWVIYLRLVSQLPSGLYRVIYQNSIGPSLYSQSASVVTTPGLQYRYSSVRTSPVARV